MKGIVVSKVCPKCGGRGYRRVNTEPSKGRKGTRYRVCLSCGTPYVPPTLIRAALGMIALGLLVFDGAPWFLTGDKLLSDRWAAMSLWERVRELAADNGVLMFLSLLCIVMGTLLLLSRLFLGTANGSREDAAVVIRPRPDLASGTRRWPQLVMPSQWLGGKHLLGYGIALFVGVCGLGIMLLLNQSLKLQVGPLGRGLLMGLLAGAGGLVLALSAFGKRLRAPHALQRLKKDHRPPVLLLRSFVEDKAAVRNANPQVVWWAFYQSRSRTFEEVVYDLLSACGPVIAIGRPGEAVSPLGASRFWVSNANWQQVIDELIRESQLVAMIMGPTEGDDGLAWEVRRIFQLQQTSKLLLLRPPVGEDVARQRWESFSPLCENRLPPYQGGELAATFPCNGLAEVARNQDLAGSGAEPDDETYCRALLIGG